jgi:hypothetical protein
VQDAHQVDNRIFPGDKAGQRGIVMNVILDDIDGWQEDEVLGTLAPARGHDNPPAAGRQLANNRRADKAAAANDKNIA